MIHNKTKLKRIKYSFLILLAISFASIGYNNAFAQTTVGLKTDSGTSIPDTLLFKLQKAQGVVTQINAANKKGYAAEKVRSEIVDIKNNVAPIQTDLGVRGKIIDPKTLISYNLILNNSQERLTALQKTLSKFSNDLQTMSNQVVELSNDSLLNVGKNDTTARTLYTKQLIDIKQRLQAAGQLTTANLDTVSRLLADVSETYLKTADLQASITDRMQTSGKSAFRKESPYIWSAPTEKNDDNIGAMLKSTYIGQNKILGYFINSTWDNRVLLILLGGVFFLWININYRRAQKPDLRQQIGEIDLKYISHLPILPALIFILNLTPLFEPDSPSLYIELVEFALLLVLSAHFWKRIPSKDMRHWLVIVGMYMVIMFVTATVHDAVFLRVLLMAINIGSLYVGFKFYQRLKEINISKKLVKPILIIYMILNLLAVLLNAFGRITLAKVYTLTATIGLTQIIGLAVFIQILSDALELQIKVSSCRGGLFARLDVAKTRASFKKALAVLAIILWVLVFFINLSIAGGVFAFVQQVLVKPRTFGKVSFTLSNILFFSVIVYVSNILQKHIGVLFGEKSVTFSNHVEHKSSKLTLIRLVITIVGVLLAVLASGIPLDKLTVVLGALSVGIGLGMQNIVNNFVSGIILIFEKPFEIGDYIELADKKGKIQDIGIRSSKMLTQQGSQVIIPNGDLLSNRLTNWTLNSAYIKSEILFKVNIAADLNAVSKLIQEEVDKAEHTVKNMQAEVLINSVAADAVELKITVWIESIYIEPAFKSMIFNQLISRFTQEQIKIM
ncbi:mechanosensitive ion channel [Mucilaginibacter pallidiroseus]|uniref:Mechanosensitive ion channel n=2 Tax=Mucilaginibacter pallidiroseus TaxID=2599295 RepID=A0A563UIB9_9SPHI|nr:mechanosensitive ion channel [Mucilaginibacter pallidiroseus]